LWFQANSASDALYISHCVLDADTYLNKKKVIIFVAPKRIKRC